MGDIEYANEKLNATVHSLATGLGGLRERLASAYAGQGYRTPVVDGGEYAPDLAESIKALHAQLNRVQDPARGSIHATIDAMSESELQDVAREIVELSAVVEELYWRKHGAR